MSGAKYNEKKILYQLRANPNPEDFAVLYDTYVKQIYRFVYFKVASSDEAEDITSEVFLKAWHYVQAKKDINSFRGLLYRMARNAIIDLYRARANKGEVVLSEEMDIGDAGNWQAEIELKSDMESVVAALKKLKQEYQEVITLRYIEQLEINEITEIIGKGNVAVRVTLHRALKKLEELLPDQK